MKTVTSNLSEWRKRVAPFRASIGVAGQLLAPLKARLLAQWQRFTTHAKPLALKAWAHLRHRCTPLTGNHILLTVIALLLVANLFRSPSNPRTTQAVADANTEALTNAVLLTAQNQAPIGTQTAKKGASDKAFHRVLLEDDIKEKRTLLTALRQERQKLEIDLEQKQNTLKRFESDNRGVLGVVDMGVSGLNAATDNKRSDGERVVAGVVSGIIAYGLATDGGETKSIMDTHSTLQGRVNDAQKLIDSVDQNIRRSEATLTHLQSQLQSLTP